MMTESDQTPRVFILSPAQLDDKHTQALFHPRTPFPLALALHTIEGAPINDVFRFLSNLYFRGKLTYDTRFTRPPQNKWIGSNILIITANRDMIPTETRVYLEHLKAFAQTDIHQNEQKFRTPLDRDAALLTRDLNKNEVILLKSIASKKYIEPLISAFGDRLLFPSDFVNRKNMSRGGLLLHKIDANKKLAYIPMKNAIRHGARPPKLTPQT